MTRIDDWAAPQGSGTTFPWSGWACPQDLADTIVFLASDRASYINGVSIETPAESSVYRIPDTPGAAGDREEGRGSRSETA